MQFITVILLQQIFWMQGKKKMARTLSECSCKFSFLLNPIFFFFEFQDLFQMMRVICLMDLGLTLALAASS